MIGIIGGTGLYHIEGLSVVQTKTMDTPFGLPSAPLTLGHFGKEKVVFLPRHGVKHHLLPGEINYRANIWALKAAGVRRVISVSAVGSLAPKITPGDMAVPDQYFDWTLGRRVKTFFGDGMVAHISTAEPSCRAMGKRIGQAAETADVKLHTGKTYACVEGPRLGSRAESLFLKNSGCHIIGMTNVPEAFLAREAQLCYCTIAIVTDFDSWQEDPSQHASLQQVMALYRQSLGRLQAVMKRVFEDSSELEPCSCRESLKGAVLTSESDLTEEKKALLSFLRE